MQTARDVLYGRFPRDGATPRRFSILTRRHFTRFIAAANKENRKNVYSSIAWLPPRGPVLDKVSFDFDAKVSGALTAVESEQEMFQKMREDKSLAEEILGGVVEDVRALAQASIEREIPVIGVFTGMGVHVHQLYQPETRPEEEIGSTARFFVDELDLQTVDKKPIGDVMRIMKIPNTRRWDDGEFTGVWTVPLRAQELRDCTAWGLLRRARGPRYGDNFEFSDRPEMKTYEAYRRGTVDPEEVGHLELGEISDAHTDEARWYVEEYIDMPCVRERVLTRDPDHPVRQEFAVRMFNCGFSPKEVFNIIQQLNWDDFDSTTTKGQLKQIYRNGYADRSCSSMMGEGFCVRTEDPESCETYSWTGGNQEY